MKHVRALATEPPLLEQYRATYHDEELRPANEATATWNRFRDEQIAYAELRKKLTEAQQGLCIYCEQRLIDSNGEHIFGDYQIEHVQAKSGAVGRVLDWHNLALACGGGTCKFHADPTRAYPTGPNASCGQTKDSSDLPQGGDPRTFPLLDALVEVAIDGKLLVNAPNCATAGVTEESIQATIALLNLNCERLRKARQDRRDNVNKWLVPLLQELLNLANHLDSVERLQMLNLTIAGRLQPDTSGHLKAFWTTERCGFGPDAETWIANNQKLFI
jgi:uncharacterized protein (TIGR02646 family)